MQFKHLQHILIVNDSFAFISTMDDSNRFKATFKVYQIFITAPSAEADPNPNPKWRNRAESELGKQNRIRTPNADPNPAKCKQSKMVTS